MHLVTRTLRREHFSEVFRLCHPLISPGTPEAERVQLDWNTLWDHGYVLGLVIEDMAVQPAQVRGLMVTTFVRQEIYHEAKRAREPQLLKRLFARARAGEDIFEKEANIGQRNAEDGLTLLVCYIGWEGDDYRTEKAATLRSVVTNAYADRHSGFHLHSVIGEIGGPKLLDLANRIHLIMLNSYDEWATQNNQLEAPKRPYLVGTDRHEALLTENHWLTRLFTYMPPRFMFTPTQQQVLLLARAGQTDNEIADELNISLDAVKKRWSSIYVRAQEVLPGLLPEQPHIGRGVEKRRALLTHLRERPEELRPYVRDRHGRSSD
ncbi:MAG: hypothetical protein ACOYON_14555 [Fimbriimonas sp.]